jgi:hypothetical protein
MAHRVLVATGIIGWLALAACGFSTGLDDAAPPPDAASPAADAAPLFTCRFFSCNATYQCYASRSSACFMTSMISAGSFIQDSTPPGCPILPDCVMQYNAPLSCAQAASELGIEGGVLCDAGN